MKKSKGRGLSAKDLHDLPAVFRRASVQRLEAAEYLGKATADGFGFGLDAVYLGGYAVECALKALYFARTPMKGREKLYEKIAAGKSGHNLETLKGKLAGLGCKPPVEVALCFPKIAFWGTELRYQTRRILSAETRTFLSAVRTIADWAGRNH